MAKASLQEYNKAMFLMNDYQDELLSSEQFACNQVMFSFSCNENIKSSKIDEVNNLYYKVKQGYLSCDT